MAEQPNINIFEGPIPGQSMTASPDSKMPWDGPPEFAGLQEASQDLFLSLLEDETLRSIVNLLEEEVPISDIAQVILVNGYSQGKYNPDLLMMLIEPLMYMLMAIAEKFDIADVKIYRGEEDDIDDEMFDEDVSAEDSSKATQKTLKDMFAGQDIPANASAGIENSEIAQKLASIDVDSILSRPKPKQTPDSIMQRSM